MLSPQSVQALNKILHYACQLRILPFEWDSTTWALKSRIGWRQLWPSYLIVVTLLFRTSFIIGKIYMLQKLQVEENEDNEEPGHIRSSKVVALQLLEIGRASCRERV